MSSKELSPQQEQRKQRLQYFLGRLDRLESEVNALANPFDDLRDNISFMKASIGTYIQDLQNDIEQKQKRIDQLEKN